MLSRYTTFSSDKRWWHVTTLLVWHTSTKAPQGFTQAQHKELTQTTRSRLQNDCRLLHADTCVINSSDRVCCSLPTSTKPMNSSLQFQNMPDLGNFFQPTLEDSDVLPLFSSPTSPYCSGAGMELLDPRPIRILSNAIVHLCRAADKNLFYWKRSLNYHLSGLTKCTKQNHSFFCFVSDVGETSDSIVILFLHSVNVLSHHTSSTFICQVFPSMVSARPIIKIAWLYINKVQNIQREKAWRWRKSIRGKLFWRVATIAM